MVPPATLRRSDRQSAFGVAAAYTPQHNQGVNKQTMPKEREEEKRNIIARESSWQAQLEDDPSIPQAGGGL